jgi:hypothetical protein
MIAEVFLATLMQTPAPVPSALRPQATRDARPATGIIRGRVVTGDTGEPVRNCRVILRLRLSTEIDR